MSQTLTEVSVFLGHRIKHFFDDRLCLIQFYKIEKGIDRVSKEQQQICCVLINIFS